MLSFGLMALVCGAVLLAWSVATHRSQLWSLGLPIALGGQLILVVGLGLQLARLWDDNRQTADQLESVDGRLGELNKTASLLSTSHNTPSQAFFSHLAGGANPQMLLADLKGQLDLLAVQMSSRP